MEHREVRKRIEHVCGRVAGPAGPALTVVIGDQASTTGQDRGGPAPAESTMEIQRLRSAPAHGGQTGQAGEKEKQGGWFGHRDDRFVRVGPENQHGRGARGVGSKR